MGNRVLFATSGYEAELIVPMDKKDEPRDGPFKEIRVFHPAPVTPETREALDALKRNLTHWEDRGGEYIEHAFEGAYDFSGILETMERVFANLDSPAEVVVNGSRGTTPMIMAATVFASRNNLELRYYHKRTGKSQSVMYKASTKTPTEMLGKSRRAKRRIVSILLEGPKSMTSIQKAFGDKISLPSLLQHVGELERAGLVSSYKEGKMRMVKVESTKRDQIEKALK